MEQLENRIVLDDELDYIENDEYGNYLEYLEEYDDRRYENEIFERISEK